MNPTNVTASHPGRVTRSSLACLPCRSRHLKCDGTRPCCSRCTELSRQCQYARSRRGGLDRAALAERRKRLAGGESVALMNSTSSTRSTESEQHQEFTPQVVDFDLPDSHNLLDGISVDGKLSGLVWPGTPQLHFSEIQNDPLIDSYYKNFHKLHPFLPPQKHLRRLYQAPSREVKLRPLIAVMRLIGYLYSVRDWSIPLKDHVEECFSQASPMDPVMVQCRLLFSIALFWYEYKAESRSQMDNATLLAVELRMHLREFSAKHGDDDPVLQECWRRTWWMLYFVDAAYAGTLGTMNFHVLNIEATVDLPCEEVDYESGEIPEPKTLEQFNHREFAFDDTTFSSYAYLIEAVRCAALAISTVPKTAVKEDSTKVIQAADAILDGWLYLLPKDRKEVMSKTGEIDELMFQAHLLIHVATIGLHRPFSDLKFNLVEEVSSCAREPPPDTPTPDLVNVHSVRVLRSVNAQIRLLALPTQKFHHTPFTTCMVSEGTLALLSACNFILNGKELAIAREQIRMTIGCLKALGEIWPRTARNVREIQTIARHVLGLGSKVESDSSRTGSSEAPGLSGGEGQGNLGSDTDASTNAMSILPSLSSIDDLCGWYNLGDFSSDLSWENVP
ncbi:hypothetical protein BGW36DRAFT_90774 [Talaromyces proteolyticus]|uniref:Zn(2)-C6 fungal-type domain-containing protein n=1 Tax=Talaromyces proteolyticus TaxID=1131652 RepID=A0AAD4L341_9EURO|nr:uncharacterized protein BGW36DRAFT_90774 [Talaromyces proteolyticus]KAH8703719.1 hypothetical protein BGW36DRAFT_90774 [Talaromyces proteolyticus]